jgi:hypothetical protein
MGCRALWSNAGQCGVDTGLDRKQLNVLRHLVVFDGGGFLFFISERTYEMFLDSEMVQKGWQGTMPWALCIFSHDSKHMLKSEVVSVWLLKIHINHAVTVVVQAELLGWWKPFLRAQLSPLKAWHVPR